nr:hypothetical protein [uncultured bacterium]
MDEKYVKNNWKSRRSRYGVRMSDEPFSSNTDQRVFSFQERSESP